ncbi:hypothetical protein K2173_023803 [Erythroxylum novogranatense]|uniref:Viral late gene transcription factor 3 zinc ribbon domain-containing protein n=1 Tax=Erythroxylum novogranatense TaxID=1862640 RepID=A0AAV8TI20_9ROSI|nr:hypothetical protein K2173_023803 [Erythroxylum novogranatense]
MEVAGSSCPSLLRCSTKSKLFSPNRLTREFSKSRIHLGITRRKGRTSRIAAISDVSGVADPVQAGVTWQVVVGAVAGVTPFVVAGIEFSKRIIAQRRCDECEGSGLVLMDNNNEYVRCPRCGGFLPWQSWKRFFSG